MPEVVDRIESLLGPCAARFTESAGNPPPAVSVQRSSYGMWETGRGWTSEAPSLRWMRSFAPAEATPAAVRRRIAESLALPGDAKDYSLVIDSGVNALWQRRSQAAWIPEAIEGLALLELALADKCGPGSTSIGAAYFLLGLYARSGYLREAVELADRIDPGATPPQIERVRARLENLLTEDAS